MMFFADDNDNIDKNDENDEDDDGDVDDDDENDEDDDDDDDNDNSDGDDNDSVNDDNDDADADDAENDVENLLCVEGMQCYHVNMNSPLKRCRRGIKMSINYWPFSSSTPTLWAPSLGVKELAS